MAYLSACGRNNESEQITKMPALSTHVGDVSTYEAIFKRQKDKERAKELRKRQVSGDLASYYGKNRDDIADRAAAVTDKLSSIKSLFAALPSNDEISKMSERTAQIKSMLDLDLDSLLD